MASLWHIKKRLCLEKHARYKKEPSEWHSGIVSIQASLNRSADCLVVVGGLIHLPPASLTQSPLTDTASLINPVTCALSLSVLSSGLLVTPARPLIGLGGGGGCIVSMGDQGGEDTVLPPTQRGNLWPNTPWHPAIHSWSIGLEANRVCGRRWPCDCERDVFLRIPSSRCLSSYTLYGPVRRRSIPGVAFSKERKYKF